MKGFIKKSLLITIVIIFIFVSLGGVLIFNFFGKKTTTNNLTLIGSQFLTKSIVNANELPSDKLDFSINAPQYQLPLNLSTIKNLNTVLNKLEIKEIPKDLLSKNGFVVFKTVGLLKDTKIYTAYSETTPLSPENDFTAFYKALNDNKIPVFITSDSVLHLFHIFFDLTLKQIEEKTFFNYLWDISKTLFDESVKDYETSSGELKEAAKRNVAYFAVALNLLKPKENQILTDEKLKELYCQGWMSDEDCKQFIEMQKTNLNDFTEDSLLRYSFETPSYVKDLVNKELSLIENHSGFAQSPIFIYKEDYSQYVPRGHYTSKELLKNYFKALMWYGRMTFLLKGSNEIEPGKTTCGGYEGIISTYDAKIQTLQSSLITLHFLANEDVQKKWSSMYALTSFFVGVSDDLGPEEYGKSIAEILGKDTVNINDLTKKLPQIQKTLESLPYEPKIYSGLGECEMLMPCPPLTNEDIQKLKAEAKELLSQTKGFRLMGQRFTIDSWAFSEIVSPYSGEYTGEKSPLPTDNLPFTYTWNDEYPDEKENRPFTWVKTLVKFCGNTGREVRGFPRGLDLMALMGSERAYEILKEIGDTNYSDYDKKFKEIKSYFDSISYEEWNKNLYTSWLYSLKALLTPFDKGYPTFMQTKAWQDKELTTALSSWAELRHDTILYVKQSYTMAEKGGDLEEPVAGYVEPVPQLYKRMINMVNIAKNGFDKLIPDEEKKLEINSQLEMFLWNLNRLYEISKKELTGTPLDESDTYFIKYFGDALEGMIKHIFRGESNVKLLESSMVADVHTEGNTKLVLEEGTGFIDTMLVAVKTPDGKINITVGPVFSYYEFKQKMGDRLTDEKWKEMLSKGEIPKEPVWVKSYKGN